jgi:LPS sulfotransferase NodH
VQPVLSYTIWFSQRTGSTLLCNALQRTGIAGRPGELLLAADLPALYKRHGARTPKELRARIWEAATTPNGVLGLKYGIYEPYFGALLDEFRQLEGHDGTRPGIWENTFPNSRHIFMTRRNKVRLAVSWWKAIQSKEWHRLHGTSPRDADIAELYDFSAIDRLLAESVLREAATQEFFAENEIEPLTIAYEDFVGRYEATVRQIVRWLGLPASAAAVAPPAYERLADAVSEDWVQRFRREKQARWNARGW